MSQNSDRELLFGLLALQNGFIDKDQLLAAFSRWSADSSRTLGHHLADLDIVSSAQRQALDQLVELHLEQNDNDTQQSLMTLVGSDIDEAHSQLLSLENDEIEQSIVSLRSSQSETAPPRSTGESNLPQSGSRFSILRPLPGGEGGMGVINVAKDEELGREVALKQIREDRVDRELFRDKFRQEAEITGNLEHPGIVPVYGLGIDDEGLPWYAMRLVKGDTLRSAIKQFHRERELGWRNFESVEFRDLVDRLIDVAQAVSYAHSRGVLHRDLKPGNVMIGRYGETLLIDWGLARPPRDTPESATRIHDEMVSMLDLQSGSDAPMTAHGSMIGTLGYAPPEQIRGDLELMDAASDVYGLGAILYQILCGKPTIPGRDRPLEQVKRDALRGNIVSPNEHAKQAPKPLAAICMKALALEPGDRYQTADEMIEELQRWKADQPVEASPESLVDRVSRFFRRNRSAALATAASLAAIALIASVALIAVNRQRRIATTAADSERQLKVEAQQQREKADQLAASESEAKQRAQQLAERNQKVVDEFVAAFSSANPSNEGVDVTMTARDVLDKAQQRLRSDSSLNEDPLTRATLLHAIGTSLMALGANEDALAPLQLAHDLRKKNDEVDLDTGLGGAIDLATAMLRNGLSEEARQLYQKSLDIAIEKLGDRSDRTLQARSGLAAVLLDTGKTEEALPLLQEIVAVRRELFDENDLDTLKSMATYGLGLLRGGQIQKSIAVLEEAFELERKHYGPTHPDTLTTMSLLADAYKADSRKELAMEMLRESNELIRKRLGGEHPLTIDGLRRLAWGEMQTGNLEKSLELFEELHRLSQASLGPDHITSINNAINLATALNYLGRYQEALVLAEETEKPLVRKHGKQHSQYVRLMYTLASIDGNLGLYEEAIESSKKALEIQEQLSGSQDDMTLDLQAQLGELYLRTGDREAALELVEKTWRTRKVLNGEDDLFTLQNLFSLAEIRYSIGQTDKAIELFRDGIKRLRSVHGEHHPDLIWAAKKVAQHYRKEGKTAEAIEYYRMAFDTSMVTFGADNAGTWDLIGQLWSVYSAVGRNAEMVEFYERLMDETKLDEEEFFIQKQSMIISLSESYYEAGEGDKSVEVMEKLVEILSDRFGAESDQTFQMMGRLAFNYYYLGMMDRSIPLFEETLEIYRRTRGPLHAQTLNLTRQYAVALIRAEEFDKALDMVDAWRESVETSSAANQVELISVLAVKLESLVGIGDYEAAAEALKEHRELERQFQEFDRLQAASLEGAILIGQKKWADAESLLTSSTPEFVRLSQGTEAQWYLPVVAQRMIDLYTGLEDEKKMEHWKQQKEVFESQLEEPIKQH